MPETTWPNPDLPGVVPKSGPYWVRRKGGGTGSHSEPLIAYFTRSETCEAAGWWRPLQHDVSMGISFWVAEHFDLLGPVQPWAPQSALRLSSEAHAPETGDINSGGLFCSDEKQVALDRIAELENVLGLADDLLRTFLALTPGTEGTPTVSSVIREIHKAVGFRDGQNAQINFGMVSTLRENMECSRSEAHKALVLARGDMNIATAILQKRRVGNSWIDAVGGHLLFKNTPGVAPAQSLAPP